MLKVKTSAFMLFILCFITWLIINYSSANKESNPGAAKRLTSVGDVNHSNVSTRLLIDDPLQKVILRIKLEKEGRALAENGYLDQAISKYKEALDPEIINYEHEKSTAMGAIMEIRKWRGEYDEALAYLQWFIESNPNEESRAVKEDFEDETEIAGILNAKQILPKEKREIEALLAAQKSGSSEPVYQHLQYLERRFRKFLPPNGFNTTSSVIVSDFIRLFDHIADYEAGTSFVKRFLTYETIKDKAKLEFESILTAFEQDKAEGFKGCLTANPGEACMGRATKALIQSDYFSW